MTITIRNSGKEEEVERPKERTFNWSQAINATTTK